jgi:hypothetical protein
MRTFDSTLREKFRRKKSDACARSLFVALCCLGLGLTARAETFPVTNTNDTGAGSLRQAITEANANPGADTISFDIAGAGVHTISPASALPTITDPVIIDGYTQPGASENTLAESDDANLLIELEGSSAGFASGLRISAGSSTVRGLAINRFVLPTGSVDDTLGNGILLEGAGGNHIEGNFVGTDPGGTLARPNTDVGIFVSSPDNIIGGTTPETRNVISGNAPFDGVYVSPANGIGDASGNVIQGNFIGTTANGVSALGNARIGVTLTHGAHDNLVGGTVAGAGNRIAFNGAVGVEVDVATGIGNAIQSNSIHSNGGLGIDLEPGGVTPNDPGDADTGPNDLQNFPVISGLSFGTGEVTINGTLNSEASKTYRLEFFANDKVDPSGYGEGQTFLGFEDVTTDGSGDASFSVNFPVAGTSTAFTATATDPDGNTSEFSAAFTTKLLNISTRMQVLTDDNVLIGGFIVTGISPKKVIVRAIGPSLTAFGVPGALMDPTLELNAPDASVTSNDNWKESQQAEIEATGLQPTNDAESAILQTLEPGAYTAIVRGVNGTTGVGLVEAYDLDQPADSQLANISTRGFVDTDANVMIGGFIIGPNDLGDATVLVRAIGPSLENFGVANALQDPVLELHSGDGDTIATNDGWRDTQETEITATGLMPTDDRESASLQTLAPGNYTAIVRGVDDTTGVGLVEVYHLQ